MNSQPGEKCKETTRRATKTPAKTSEENWRKPRSTTQNSCSLHGQHVRGARKPETGPAAPAVFLRLSAHLPSCTLPTTIKRQRSINWSLYTLLSLVDSGVGWGGVECGPCAGAGGLGVGVAWGGVTNQSRAANCFRAARALFACGSQPKKASHLWQLMTQD